MGTLMTVRTATVLICAVTLALPRAARADHVEIMLAKGKRTPKVTVVRQVLDFVRGFDQFMVEEYAAPANKRVARRELAAGKRTQLVPLGQYELYMKSVGEERTRELERFEKKGYAPVCNIPVAPEAGSPEVTFEGSGRKLRLVIAQNSRRDSVLLEREATGKSYNLMRFPDGPPTRQGEPRRIRRTIAQVAVLAEGRMLAVVVRKHMLPSPAKSWKEEFYFFPLKRAFNTLGVKYPMAEWRCKSDAELE